ncbi:MAG TPA: DUF2520 domain-containing protein [Bryobacteraceae bacterium]|nr:DUF2520 domain-containing protein [Bryobacteraceae bacterium]
MAVALVGGGKVSQSFVARLPSLAGQLGPVKALSYRVASRVSNALRAGYPARDYRPLEACRLILICVPEAQLSCTLSDLAAAPVNWAAKSVVLCGSWRSSEALETLTRRGASCASLNPIVDAQGDRFLGEGAPAAMQRIRELVGGARSRVIEISCGSKPLFLAGMTLTGVALIPLLAAVTESLRAAGLSTPQALSILGAAVDQAARAYSKAGRKAWSGPLVRNQREALDHQLDALLKTDPPLERFFRQTSIAALEFFHKDAKWLAEQRPSHAAAKSAVS